ncbi:MAG: hypothetical protein GXO78_13050 [Calditrichaeota bacterium]|nr:hypothetical protein [Calditrichota bacterium]
MEIDVRQQVQKTWRWLRQIPGTVMGNRWPFRTRNGHQRQSESPRVDIQDTFFHQSLGFAGWIATRILALDFQEDRIVYSVFRRLGRQMSLQKAGVEIFQSSGQVMENAWAETVSNILKQEYRAPMEVWISFSHPSVTCMEMVFPVVSETQELEKAIYFQLKGEVEGFKEDQFIWLYQKLSTFEEEVIQQQRILVVLIPRTVIQHFIKMLAPYDIHPDLLIPRQLVLLQSYQDMVSHSSDALFMDVGRVSTHIFLYRKGKPVFTRQVAFGLQHMETPAASNGRNHEPFFRRLEETNKPFANHVVGERLKQFLEEYHQPGLAPAGALYAEILRTLEYAHHAFEFYGLDNIFVSGLGANSPELVAYLSRELSMPILPLIPHFPTLKSPVQFPGQFVGFIGFPAYTRLRQTFVPPEVRKARLLKKVNMTLAAAFLALLIGVTSMTVHVKGEVERYRQELQQLKENFAQLTSSNQEFRDALLRKVAIQNRLQTLGTYLQEETEVVPMMQYFSQNWPDGVVLDELRIYHVSDLEEEFPLEVPIPEDTQTAVQLVGRVLLPPIASETQLLEWINQLEEASVFRSVRLIERGMTPENNQYRFNIMAFR